MGCVPRGQLRFAAAHGAYRVADSRIAAGIGAAGNHRVRRAAGAQNRIVLPPELGKEVRSNRFSISAFWGRGRSRP